MMLATCSEHPLLQRPALEGPSRKWRDGGDECESSQLGTPPVFLRCLYGRDEIDDEQHSVNRSHDLHANRIAHDEILEAHASEQTGPRPRLGDSGESKSASCGVSHI